MQILTTSGTREVNFIPRETILGTKTYKVVIKSEAQNKVIVTDENANFGEGPYYYAYRCTEALIENQYYTVTITNTTDNAIIFRDKIFCTNQASSTYQMTSGIYTQHNTGANEYKYYSAP